MDRIRDPGLPEHPGGLGIVLFVAVLAGIGVAGAWWSTFQAGAEVVHEVGLGFSLAFGVAIAWMLAVAWPRFRKSQPALGVDGQAAAPSGAPQPDEPPPAYDWIRSFAGPALVVARDQAAGDWRIVACNDRAAQSVHLSEDELLGQELSQLWRHAAGWPPSALQALLQRYTPAAESGVQVIPRRGGERWEVRYQALASSASQAQLLITLWPVSEALGHADDNQAFSYAVSHDLRAPLRVVEGFSRIIKEDYGQQLDRVCNDHLDRVMAAAMRMNAMIDALLAQAQLASRPLSRQCVDLSQLAEFVIDDLRRQHPERQVDIVIQPGLQVLGDATLLRMVMDNLLGNAWKYSAQTARAKIEFGYLSAGARAPEVEVEAASGYFYVRDNGVGFDMRFADRLFGLFQRLHSASDYPGTGLGLASVRRIVHRHGGEIRAESVVGEGTTVYFTLGEE